MQQSFIHADIFFFIASIALVCLAAICIIAGIYLIQILKNVRDISEMIKNGVENVKERMDELKEKIGDLAILRFLFKKKRKK